MSIARIIRSAEQPSVWLLRDHATPLLTGTDTRNEFAFVISRIHPGDGPPPHIHRNEDEMFYVLEGEMTFLYGDAMVKAPAGSFVYAPRDVVHAFKCTSDTAAKMILIVTPTAFMDFAMTLSHPAEDFMRPPTLTPEILGKLMAVAPQYGIEMLPGHALPATVVNAPEASKQVWVMGEHVSYLATSVQTGGRFTIVEIQTAPAGGPPPHAHTNEDELFYVIAGRHDVTLGDTTGVAGPGDLVFIPRGSRHRYSNIDATPGKLLSLHTPGGFEAFFDEVGVEATDKSQAPSMPPAPVDAISALLARHGMTV